MKRTPFLPLITYGILIGFVVTWWSFAFKQNESVLNILDDPTTDQTHPLFPITLGQTDRELILKALGGDYALMAQLIIEWDVDAQILASQGFSGVQQLDKEDLIRSQLLHRHLKWNPKPLQENPLNNTLVQFLPQTYAAASFLLAIASPEEIVALPSHLREQTQLFPAAVTSKIPLDIDRIHAEQLFLNKPKIAFVAEYSSPATIETLKNQGIVLHFMKNAATFADISDELMHLGKLIHREQEAELLKIFMKAAMISIDNQLHILLSTETAPESMLFLNYHQNFSIPTQKTITGQLLQRLSQIDLSLQIAREKGQSSDWMITVDKERLHNIDPDCLIIASSENSTYLRKEIFRHSSLQNLSAVKNRRVIFVDEAIQHSPSQYIVLAYYDLVQALKGAL